MPLSKKHIASPDVRNYYDHPNFMDMISTPVMHFCGCGNAERVLAMQAKFISNFHTNVHGSILACARKDSPPKVSSVILSAF